MESATGKKSPLTIVVLDEEGRYRELYGRAFERLGVRPKSGHDLSPEEILAMKPDAILLSREWSHSWRLTAAAARRAHVPVIYVMDGVIEWSYIWNNLSYIRPNGTMLQPLMASDLCVIGQHPARILASLGLAQRIHVVGLPRYDSFDRSRTLNPTRRPRIIVATARTASHNVEQQVFVLRALRDLKNYFTANPVAEVVWRIAADLAEELELECDVRGTLAHALSGASGLITLPSTCVLEGMLKGLPVAQVEYRPVPLYVTTAWEIRSPAHIPDVIQELLYPPANKLAYQDACLADELAPGNASERLAEVILDVLARPQADGASAIPQPTQVFGRLDYRLIHSELSAFAVSEKSVLQYELDAAYGRIKKLKQDVIEQRRCILEVAEALAESDLDEVSFYSFLDHLHGASCVARDCGSSSAGDLAHNGRSIRTLFLHPPAQLTFHVPVSAAGNLHFAISLHPDVWNNAESGPCRFRVTADGIEICDTTIDPLNNATDRRWIRFDLVIPESATGKHIFTFETEGVGSNAFRWALWRVPMFIWKTGKDQPPNSLPRVPEISQPGRTIL